MSQEKELAFHIYEIHTDLAIKFGIDLANRTVQVVGEITDETFCMIDTALTLLEAQSKASITIKINSLGGSVYAALAIVGRMKAAKCHIITEGYGACMSAASLILAAGKKRRMSSLAWVMYHEMSYEIGGSHSQAKHMLEQADREEQAWVKTMVSLTGSSIWEDEGKFGKDFYLNPEQCKELGVIDEIF